MPEPDRELKAKPGDRIYPFTKVFREETNPFLMRWRLDAGAWTIFTNPGLAFTDKLGQARLFSYIVAGYGVYVFELEITDVEDQEEDPDTIEVHVESRILTGRAKKTVKGSTLAPFNDVIVGDGLLLDAIEYSVGGDVIVAKTAILPDVMFNGKHTGGNNSAVLIEGEKNWNNIGIRFGVDIVKNVTDGSVGIIDATSGDGAELVAILSGGSDDDWDTNDEYKIVSGDLLNVLVKRFKYKPTVAGLHLVKLHVTALDTSEASVVIPVQVIDTVGGS